MGIRTHSYVWIGLQACNKCLNSSHVKSQMTPGFCCAIFSEDSYLQEEVKAAPVVHKCPLHGEPLAPAILLSPLPRSNM